MDHTLGHFTFRVYIQAFQPIQLCNNIHYVREHCCWHKLFPYILLGMSRPRNPNQLKPQVFHSDIWSTLKNTLLQLASLWLIPTKVETSSRDISKIWIAAGLSWTVGVSFHVFQLWEYVSPGRDFLWKQSVSDCFQEVVWDDINTFLCTMILRMLFKALARVISSDFIHWMFI